MTTAASSLTSVYEGWDGYQVSLARAITPLSPRPLAYRAAPHLRSVGEIASHISLGRIDWFQRMRAPGSDEIARQAAEWEPEQAIVENAAELVRRLDVTWRMIESTLTRWTIGDLAQTYRHTYWGKTYAISRQWTIWRIMTHDVHHGGQLTEPPLAEPSESGL